MEAFAALAGCKRNVEELKEASETIRRTLNDLADQYTMRTRVCKELKRIKETWYAGEVLEGSLTLAPITHHNTPPRSSPKSSFHRTSHAVVSGSHEAQLDVGVISF